MATLLKNLISSNSSVTKIRKIKEDGFPIGDNLTWSLVNVTEVTNTLFAVYESGGSLIPAAFTSVDSTWTGDRYDIIRIEKETAEEGEYYYKAVLNQTGNFRIKNINYQVESVPNIKQEDGVKTGILEEKTSLTLAMDHLITENTHYYPLSSFTDFYLLNDIETFQPYPTVSNADFYLSRLSSKRIASLTKDNRDLNNQDLFGNGEDPIYFYPTPFFSEKGAAATMDIKNLLFFKEIDLKYVDSTKIDQDHPENTYYLKDSPWHSCWSNCTTKILDYTYPASIDGTLIIPNNTGDVIFSRELGILAVGDYYFSFFIKLDSTNSNDTLNNNVFYTEIKVGLDNGSTLLSGDFIINKDLEDKGNNIVTAGERWERIIFHTTVSTAASYTLKIIWPERTSMNLINRKVSLNGLDYFYQLRIAGLLFEKAEIPWTNYSSICPSIYDAGYVNYLDLNLPNLNPENPYVGSDYNYIRLKPVKKDQANILIIGENYDEANPDTGRSFNASSYIITYKRYIEGRTVWDNIGNRCQIGYNDGNFIIRTFDGNTWTTYSPNPVSNNRPFRSCVWETVVIQYNNTSADEIIDIYYPEDEEPRFHWSGDIYQGNISPIEITTAVTPDTKAHAYLLLGSRVESRTNEIDKLLTYPAYYKDLIILKGRIIDKKFRKNLTNPLFRLELNQKQPIDELELNPPVETSLMAGSIQEGAYKLNKAVTLD